METRFKVDISCDLRKKIGSKLEIKIEEEIGSADLKFLEPVRVDATLTNLGKELSLSGEIATAVELTCSRCLEKFAFPVSSSLDLLFVKEEEEKEEEIELSQEDLKVVCYKGDEIDLAKTVREEIIISLPMSPICRKDCKGLCPHCGQNLNKANCDCPKERIDPRLAKLSELVK